MTSLTDMFVRLGARLRAAGLPADPEAVRSLIRAAALLDPLDPQQIRAASRSLTCTQRGHLRIHDAVFDSFFGLSQAHNAEDPGIEVAMSRPEVSAEGAGGAEASEITEASRAEHLLHVDLGHEGGGEAVALIDGLVFRPPRGAAHRSRPGHTGVVDTRRVLRELVRSEEISAIPRRRHLYRQRPVTLVADVSASMTPWRESVLRFLGRSAEALGARCFTAGTRLTRVDGVITASGTRSGTGGATAVLSAVLDAGGGTRLGDSLFELLKGRTKDLVRGSVVVIISDGWEHGDCAELERACARLARLSHRFLWVNPRAGRAGFEARTRGLAVAAGHAETVLPATTVAQWQTVARAITVRTTAHGTVAAPTRATAVPSARAEQEVWA